jgi:DNA replication protein DnaC
MRQRTYGGVRGRSRKAPPTRLITSNLPFANWNKIFKDEMTTAAAIDRLVHHAMILELNTESYRMANAKKRNSKPLLKKDK